MIISPAYRGNFGFTSRVVRADCLPAWRDDLHFNHVETVGLKISKGELEQGKKMNMFLDRCNGGI